ncbi:MAG: DNA polymerase III subunit [Candidatus Marinimicrobia bacterium]|nr:DNA polymerase III subunit [Candidatus Neomarinimicrobiota bacterium]
MIYSDLILNERNWDNLLTAFRTGRLHHALLFHGPSGTGKSAHAIELAATLNCKDSTSSNPCGLCPSCKKVRSFQHGNVRLVLPFPRKTNLDKNSPSIKALTDADLTSLQEQMKTMGMKPYFKIALNNANTILINSIRDLKNELYLSPPDAGGRIVLILDAEYLCIPNATSANALLKILEEPPEKTYFILVTSRSDLMLETILSRCQKIYFPALPEDAIESFLVDEGESPLDAHLIARLSEGNMHLARNFQGMVPQLYENVKTILNAVFTKQPDLWIKFHKEVSRLKQSGRIEMDYFFRTGIFAFRDLLFLAETGNTENVVFVDNLQKYQSVLEKFPQSNWAECIQLMEDALSFIRANGYLPLVINAMLMDMGKVLKGDEVKRFSLQY